MHEFLTWLYGRSARNNHIRMMAQKAIVLLRKNQSMEYQQLCRELGIAFDKYQKPKRTFYFVVNQLKKVQLIQEKRIPEEADKAKYKTHYLLTPDRFRGYMDKTIDDFHTSVKA